MNNICKIWNTLQKTSNRILWILWVSTFENGKYDVSVNLLFVFHHLTKRERGSIMWKELGNRWTKETQVHLLFSKSELLLTHVNSRGHSCYKDVFFSGCEQLLEEGKTTNVESLSIAFDISQNIFWGAVLYFEIGCRWQHINMLAFLNRAVSGREPSQGQRSICWNQRSTRSPLMKALN